MFGKIGEKIKVLATTMCIIGMVVSVVVGIFLIAKDESMIIFGILLAIAGPIVSWLSSFTLYGFGQLVENSDILVSQGYNRESMEWEEEPISEDEAAYKEKE